MGDVQGGTLAGHDAVSGLIVDLDRLDAALFALRQEDQFVACFGHAGDGDAGHDGAIPLNRKHLLDRKAEDALGGLGDDLSGHVAEGFIEGVEALAGNRGDRQDRGRVEEGASEELADLPADRFDPLG